MILMYHRVADDDCDPWELCVSPARFATHLEVLGRLAEPMALTAFVAALDAGALPPRAVAVTFDDGYVDNLHVAAPLLERAGVPATVFISTGQTDAVRGFWWDELAVLMFDTPGLPEVLTVTSAGESRRLEVPRAAADASCGGWRAGSPPPTARHAAYDELWRLLQPLSDGAQRAMLDALWHQAGAAAPTARTSHRALSAQELRDLSSVAGLSIGAHTITHPRLSAHAESVQRHELLDSKVRLEQLLRRPVTSMSYPYGDASDVTVRVTRELGYRVACTTRPGRPAAGERLRLPRLHVRDWTAEAFAAEVATWFAD